MDMEFNEYPSRSVYPMQGGTTMKLGGFIIPFLLAAFLLVGTSAAFSAEKEAPDQMKDPWAWGFNFAVYGWLPWAPVDIKLGDTEAHIPEGLDVIFDSLRFAAMFEAEVNKGPIGAFVSPIYVNLDYSENKAGPFEMRKVTLKEQAWFVDYSKDSNALKLHVWTSPGDGGRVLARCNLFVLRGRSCQI